MSTQTFPSTGEPPTAEMCRSVGPRPEQFVAMAGPVTKYLGLADADDKQDNVGNVTFSFFLCV